MNIPGSDTYFMEEIEQYKKEIHRLKAELEFYQKQEMRVHIDCDVLERQLAEANAKLVAWPDLFDENMRLASANDGLRGELSEAREREAGMAQMYEELYEHHFKEHHTPDYERVKELETQLDEARAELEALADCLNGSSKATYTAEMFDTQLEKLRAEARQEAARKELEDGKQ